MAVSELTVASASHLQQTRVAEQVHFAVARKTLDAAEQQGAAALTLLESAAQISDSSAQEPGKGRMVDLQA